MRSRVGTILVNQTFGSLVELSLGGIVPPVVQISILIVLGSLVIKTMGNFMTSHGANCGEIDQIRNSGSLVEKHWVQNTSRDNEFVLGRFIVGVYCWRGH